MCVKNPQFAFATVEVKSVKSEAFVRNDLFSKRWTGHARELWTPQKHRSLELAAHG